MDIDLKQIKRNALAIKNCLKNDCKLCVVLKADAYGHGAVEVANAVYTVADYFAVALLEEAKELRFSGIKKQILVLIPILDSEISKAIELNVALTVDRLNQLLLIEKECEKLNTTVNVHLKYNTGMNRFGITGIDELKKIFKCCKSFTHVNIIGLYSHFSCPEKKREKEKALRKFLLANNIAKGYNKNILCHISASTGFLLGGADFDMVRIGLLIYGYKTVKSSRVSVRPAMQIKIPVIAQRTLRISESALYGKKPSLIKRKISLIRYGYADGLERKCVKGQYNHRCMDVTALKGDYKGFYVIKDVLKEAQKYKTIPYEVLCKLSLRSEKNYKR